MKATVERVSTKVAPKRKQRAFPVWVVVRHTLAGDERISVRDQGSEPDRSKRYAMEEARDIAETAALHYGQGSASVFGGTLTLNSRAEQEGS